MCMTFSTQVSRTARERNEDKRLEYQALIGDLYSAEMLVFLDESHCDRRTMQRRWAWAPEGDRAHRKDFFIRGTKYSVLPAISLDGILHLDIITRSWTAVEFENYIETLLDNMKPYPQPNSVLVMDNASTHHFEGLREIVEGRGMHLIYLPAYSPDFNPIEEGFSAMKAWLRQNRDYALLELTGDGNAFGVLWEALYTAMTSENIAGWFADSGYIA
uniref:Tc1-like transposase DDE domain-containing protein n=1 Tax=Mycena chlorophos TaxID=658473 RepID=A0ABQ0KVS5_MYCCL|nr:predicted protein [Mycena chlorophos]